MSPWLDRIPSSGSGVVRVQQGIRICNLKELTEGSACTCACAPGVCTCATSAADLVPASVAASLAASVALVHRPFTHNEPPSLGWLKSTMPAP